MKGDDGFTVCNVLMRVLIRSRSKLQGITEHQAMKAYGGCGCTAPRILDLGTRNYRYKKVMKITRRRKRKEN
jgi:hypothetical protein